MSTLGPNQLSWHLLDSIKSIDHTIRELKWTLSIISNQEDSQKIKERVERLIHTRFTLVYQLLDLVGNNPRCILAQRNIGYKQLKRDLL